MFDGDDPSAAEATPLGDAPCAPAAGAHTDPEHIDLGNEALEALLCDHAAHLTVAQCRLVLLLAEWERRGTWAAQGLRSCAHWCNWRLGTTLSVAREQLRVGRALEGLPRLREAFATGALSYSKVRALTRIATPALEEKLVEMAGYATAAQLERIVAGYRAASPTEGTEALARHRGRYLRTYCDPEGAVVLRARLSPEDGATVRAAIEAAGIALVLDRVTGRGGELASSGTSAATEEPTKDADEPAAAAAADALVALCESSLAQGCQPVGARSTATMVLVHLDEAVTADTAASGCARIEGIGAISAHTAQRLLCTGAVGTLGFSGTGAVAAQGATRQVPRAMRRAILARDEGCRWPGCTQHRFVDLHHVRFVRDGGPTRADNLVTTCRHHHRLVHEGGFTLTMEPAGRVRVYDPTGHEVPAAPALGPPAGPDLAAQHRADGLAVGPETLAYRGERFDLAITIDVLGAIARKATGDEEPATTPPLATPPGANASAPAPATHRALTVGAT